MVAKKKTIRDLITDDMICGANMKQSGTCHESKKPGPKTGSGKRTGKLLIRCMPELNTVLQALQKDSWSFKGMSTSDILHIMVASAAKTQFLNDCSKEVASAVDAISTVAYKNYDL